MKLIHTTFFYYKNQPQGLTKRYINQPEATFRTINRYTYKFDEVGGLIGATCSDLTHRRTSSKPDGLIKSPDSEPGAQTGLADP